MHEGVRYIDKCVGA